MQTNTSESSNPYYDMMTKSLKTKIAATPESHIPNSYFFLRLSLGQEEISFLLSNPTMVDTFSDEILHMITEFNASRQKGIPEIIQQALTKDEGNIVRHELEHVDGLPPRVRSQARIDLFFGGPALHLGDERPPQKFVDSILGITKGIDAKQLTPEEQFRYNTNPAQLSEGDRLLAMEAIDRMKANGQEELASKCLTILLSKPIDSSPIEYSS